MNFPMSLQPNLNSMPLPDIVGPRYQRPHSYEEHQGIPRPFSPKIRHGVHNPQKYKHQKKTTGSFSSIMTDSHRPGSNDEKKKTAEKHFIYNDNGLLAITQKKVQSKTVISKGYLIKVQQEAHGTSKLDN